MARTRRRARPAPASGKDASDGRELPDRCLRAAAFRRAGEDAGQRIEAKARLRFAVAQALAQGRIGFHYQPVVRAANPRLPAFFEMLARLRLPDGQMLPAGAFLPAVEDGPLGRAIDRLALAQALKALAGDPGLRLSVNMSPRSMGDEEWLAILAAAARGGSGVCGRLILEITEDAAMRGRRADHRLHGPRARHRLRLRARRLRRRRHRLQALPRLPLRHGQDRRRLRAGRARGARRAGAGRVPERRWRGTSRC